MDRVFDADLDMLLADSRNLAMLETMFAKNLKAHLANALYRIEPTSQCRVLANRVFAAGEALLAAHDGWMFRKDKSDEEAGIQQFAASVEELRVEMRRCAPSATMKALGIE